MPGAPSLARALGAQRVGYERSEARFPLAHGFVDELEATLQEHLGEVAQAQHYSVCGLPLQLTSEVPNWHQLAYRTAEESARTDAHAAQYDSTDD